MSQRRLDPDGERVVVTVAFFDLVGSTELSTRLDLEELRDVVRGFHAVCDDGVSRRGGTVTNIVGDGVLALFGAPIAHEDAPVRAVRAALDVMDAVAALTPPPGCPPIRARAGIHTGLSLVASMGRGASELAVDVVGETPNLASRLEGEAGPGEIVVSGDTAAAVAGWVELDRLGARWLKGVPRPIEVHRVIRSTPVTDRIQARRHLPLAGRRTELEALAGVARRAADGRSTVAVISGDAGIGKSRLVAEALAVEPLRDAARTVLRGTPDHRGTPWHPVDAHLRSLPPSSRPPELVAQLEADSSADPEAWHDRTVRAFRDWLLAAPSPGLRVVVVEDVHWLDPSTLAAVEEVAAEEHGAPVLVLLVTRPDATLDRVAGGHVVRLALRPLSRDELTELVSGAATAISDVDLETVIARSEGVPLFAEELVAASETSSLDAIPTTLSGLLQVRLERVGGLVDLVRLCSVIGRDVDTDLLRAVVDDDGFDLDAALDHLRSAGVLDTDGHTVAFHHVLLRDAAYESLLRDRRRDAHARVAGALRAALPERAARHPEELARHLVGAGDHAGATGEWQRAAARATERHALAAAIEHHERALDALLRTDEGPDRDRRELEILLALSQVVYRLHGGGDQRMVDIHERATVLASAIDDLGQRYATIQLLFSHWVSLPDHARSRTIGQQMVDLADASGRPKLRMLAHTWHGAGFAMEGDAARAITHLEIALDAYDPSRWQDAGHDPGVTALVFLGVLARAQGRPDDAAAHLAHAAAVAEATTPFSRSWHAIELAKYHASHEEVDDAERAAEVAFALADEHAFAQIRPQADAVLGWVDSVRGRPGALERMRTAIDAAAKSGARSSSTVHLLLLARAERDAGLHAEAQATLDEALAFAEQTGEGLHRRALLRLQESMAAQSR